MARPSGGVDARSVGFWGEVTVPASDTEPPPSRCDVSVQNVGHYAGVGASDLRRWTAALAEDLAPSASSLCLRLTSDREVRRLNGEYRSRDRATDVLSFPGGVTPEGFHLGDVVISVPTARRQATAAGHPVGRELRTLALHGILHCLGHDHETDDGEMNRLERGLRRRWINR